MRALLRPLAIFRKAVQSNRAVQFKHPFTTALVWRAMEDKESLKKRLTPLQYHVTQEAGTERPFTALVWRAMEDKESLKKRLTPLQYHVTQEAGTERPFTGCYNKFYDEGMYVCVVCRQDLFSSKTKYDSGCGWPAFNDVLAKEKVTLHQDTSAVGANILLVLTRPGMVRTEVRCSKCSAHLGHVFNDGPAPTKKRFCINSASLDFIPAEERKD